MNFHAENITFIRANPSQSSLLLNIRILYIKGRQRNDIRICYPISGTDTYISASDIIFCEKMYFNMHDVDSESKKNSL